MKKICLILSIFLLNGCLSLNTSLNGSNTSSNSSIVDGNLVAKKLIIDSSNYNNLDNVEIKDVINNPNGKEDLFTFNPQATLKVKDLSHISEVSIRVFQTFSYLNVYTNYDCNGDIIEGSKESGNREATYTYKLNNNDELTIKNDNETYMTHVYEIIINYYVVDTDGNDNSSSTSSSSSPSSTSNSSINSNSSSNSSSSNQEDNDYNDNLKQGLKGTEWLEYYGDEQGHSCQSIPASGNPKVLVVPVLFKNESISNSSKVLQDIDTTFNGNASDTSWESVDSFYKKTSYGKLDMDIDVLDYWITLDKTCTELARLNQNTYPDPTWYALEYVVKQLKNKGIDMKDYDSDSDGFIDGVWMVYGKNYSSASNEEQDIMWAYTYWKNDNSKNVNSPVANVYAWASVEFMYEGNYSKPDAHTFIHETGHMLGLDDYYDYDKKSRPAGFLDMMDYNIGDHNAYSKYLLDWVNPHYVTKKSTFTIKPFESSGDCIIVPTSLQDSKSPLNEYLIIEYYTPTGLNESDSKSNYQGDYPLMFTENGIKIYHVDSRVGTIKASSYDYEFKNYLDNVTYDKLISSSSSTTYCDIVASNTASYSYYNSYKKLTLLSSKQNSKKGYYYNNTNATNADLYQDGDSVTSFTFNNGKSLLFKITIDNISASNATISFS